MNLMYNMVVLQKSQIVLKMKCKCLNGGPDFVLNLCLLLKRDKKMNGPRQIMYGIWGACLGGNPRPNERAGVCEERAKRPAFRTAD